jgi:hypothetical protein
MTLNDWFAERDAAWKTRTRREQHGAGKLTLRDELPLCATGCTLPDGSLTDADCLVPGTPSSADTEQVWTRHLPGTTLRRRGRVNIEPGRALLFLDEPDADVSPGQPGPAMPELQRDLGLSFRIRGLVRSDLFATLLYAALCNTKWRHMATRALWSCSWRSAGGIVAMLRDEGDYLDWYCSMGEGLVDEQVLAEIQALGWELVSAEPLWD